MKKKKYHHKNLRNDVITIATKNIDVLGSGKVSLRTISAEIGVSPMAIYHHFPNKKELLHVLAEKFRRDLDMMIGSDLDQYHRADDKLVLMGKHYIHYAIHYPSRFHLMFSPEHTLTPQEMMHQQPVLFGRFSQLVVEHFKLTDPQTFLPTTLSIWSSVHGLAILSVAGPIQRMVNSSAAFDVFLEYHLRHIMRD